MPKRPNPSENKDPLVSLARYSEIGFIIPAAILLGFFLGKLADYWLHTRWFYLVGLLFGAVVGFSVDELSIDDLSIYERIIPRVLRNMLVVSVLLLGPVFWFYGWAGSIGFAFGAAVSYVNFRSLTRGVEGLADRIVNRSSREKGGRIVLRFVVRYGLVGAAAYAIFKSSSRAGGGPDGRGGVGRVHGFPAGIVTTHGGRNFCGKDMSSRAKGYELRAPSQEHAGQRKVARSSPLL